MNGWRIALAVPLCGALTIWFIPQAHTLYAVLILAVVSSYIFLQNFPTMSRFVHSRKRTFEDLVVQGEPEDKDKFQSAFIHKVNILLSFFVAALVYYAKYRIEHTSLGWMEILGVIGGLISLYGRFHKSFGYILLTITYYRKKRHVRRKLSDIEGDGGMTQSVSVPMDLRLAQGPTELSFVSVVDGF